MEKAQSPSNFEYFTKAQNFLDNINLFYKLKKKGTDILAEYNEKHSNFTLANPFTNILTKGRLLGEKGNCISFVKCQNSCPDSFSFNPNKKDSSSFSFFHSLIGDIFHDYKTKIDYNYSSYDFINLLLSSDGDIIFQYLENGQIHSKRLSTNSYELFFNLPMFFSWFLKGNESKENLDRLEKFTKINNGSTFSSVYNFVKSNLDAVSKIQEYAKKLSSDVSEIEHFPFLTKMINEHFGVNFNISESSSYKIKKDIKGNLFAHINYLGTIPNEGYSNFPVKIAINKDGFVPYFVPEVLSSVQKKNLIEGWNTPFLLTKEEKYAALVETYVNSSKSMREMAKRMSKSLDNNSSIFGASSNTISIFPALKDMAKDKDLEDRKVALKKELEKNTKTVIKKLCGCLDSPTNNRTIKNEQIKIKELNDMVLSIDSSINNLSNLLSNMYKNEILINDL